ncbi:Gag protease polyprotein [Gossypium australe]|uniref:Gag protease polyprotein n=1 Tax=Gossypium australe TaxID=47621 RepID=A0A5B6VWG9_9ROSI|nr:Gag protease polyprotein [Gossypium australe]
MVHVTEDFARPECNHFYLLLPFSPRIILSIVDKIQKQGAEEFRANIDDDPERVEFWLESSMRVFDELSCTPEESLKCTVSLLRDSTYHCWKTLTSVVPRERVTWDFFLEEFQKKYISQRFVDQKQKEFLELKQGKMTVEEYEREFVRLSKYAQECLSTEAILCKRACKAEELNKEKRKAVREARDARKRSMSKSHQAQSKRSKKLNPWMTASVGQHTGSVGGTIEIVTSAVHPTILSRIVQRGRRRKESKNMSMIVESTEFVVKVSNSLGKHVLVDKVFRNCPLTFRGYCFPANLMLFPFDEFDLILGMDWLMAHNVLVNCGSKFIELRCENGDVIRVESGRSNKLSMIISTMVAEKCLRKGYKSYLAFMLNTQESEVKIEPVLVVCEYREVFPKELSGFPPVREVEFGIELVLGTTPILVAPYKMAPLELKELKVQLQELMDKGCTRLSYPSWGAPVLFVKKKDRPMRLYIDYRQLNSDSEE